MPKSTPSALPLPLDLRDRLALERTHLANERTALAYLRTALTLIIAGFSLMQFFRDNAYLWAGALLVPLGVGTGAAGCATVASAPASGFTCPALRQRPAPNLPGPPVVGRPTSSNLSQRRPGAEGGSSATRGRPTSVPYRGANSPE